VSTYFAPLLIYAVEVRFWTIHGCDY